MCCRFESREKHFVQEVTSIIKFKLKLRFRATPVQCFILVHFNKDGKSSQKNNITVKKINIQVALTSAFLNYNSSENKYSTIYEKSK